MEPVAVGNLWRKEFRVAFNEWIEIGAEGTPFLDELLIVRFRWSRHTDGLVSGCRDSHDVLNSGHLESYCYRTQLGRGIEASTPQNPQEPETGGFLIL